MCTIGTSVCDGFDTKPLPPPRGTSNIAIVLVPFLVIHHARATAKIRHRCITMSSTLCCTSGAHPRANHVVAMSSRARPLSNHVVVMLPPALAGAHPDTLILTKQHSHRVLVRESVFFIFRRDWISWSRECAIYTSPPLGALTHKQIFHDLVLILRRARRRHQPRRAVVSRWHHTIQAVGTESPKAVYTKF